MKSPHYFFRYYGRGAAWYRSHFATRVSRRIRERSHGQPTVTGEANPYYLYHPYSAARIHEQYPHARIVILLRDPVRRAYSHYWERVDNGVEPLSFPAALAAESDRLDGELERMAADPLYYSRPHDWYSYRDRGVYVDQVRRYLELFPRERIHIMSSESFYADEQAAFNEVCGFLGIPAYQLAAATRHNYRPAEPMDAATKEELRAFYRPHNEALYALLDHDFGWDR
jgi:hypothetical protein